jgi:CheY-like chemotaxis protein
MDNRKVIVITDDDAGDRFLIRTAFEEAGININVTEYQNGEELIDYLNGGCKSDSPCLVLLDLNMPKKTGIEVLEYVSTNPDICKVPIVVFTTSTDAHDIAKCKELGAIDFISKPDDYTGYLTVADRISSYIKNC